MKILLVLAALYVASAFSQDTGCDTLAACRTVLEANPNSSWAHYRIAQIDFQQQNRQSAALEFSSALKGDLEP